MSLYDIIDDISERQAVKTETGDNRIYGVMVGIVAKNFDPNSSKAGGTNSGEDAMDGRVCVTIPTRNKKHNQLHWARVAMPSSGRKWGHYFMPEVGDQVLLAFEGGNIEKPYVIGCVPRTKNKFLSDAVDKDNQFKKIVTRHGNQLVFEDNSQAEDGSKDKILLETGGKQLSIQLDNEAEKIRIGENRKEDFIEMSTKEGAGTLTINIKSKIELKVGDTVTMTLNGESGTVSIKADTILLEGNKSVTARSQGSVKVEGADFKANANTSMKLDCGGMTKIGGSSISIG